MNSQDQNETQSALDELLKSRPMNVIFAFQLLRAGMEEAAQSWRETTITDPDGMLSTLKSSIKSINDKRKVVERLYCELKTRLQEVHGLITASRTALAVMGQIDTRNIPAEQIVALLDARAALEARARSTQDAFAKDEAVVV